MVYTVNRYYLTTHIAHKSAWDSYLSYPVHEPEHRVVLKIFDTECLNSALTPKDIRLLERRLQQLTHPSLVPLLELGVEQGKPYVVNEYLPGDSLRKRLDQLSTHRFTLDAALHIIIHIGYGIVFAHQQHTTHQHIKPENIFFNTQDEALLTDFSPGELLSEIPSMQQFDDRTNNYQAPEQRASTGNAYSDQYALGCLFYEMLTGTLPFTLNAQSLIWQAPTAPSMLVPTLPHSLDMVILRTLAEKPEERYDDVATFLATLIAATQQDPPAFPFAHITHVQDMSGAQAENVLFTLSHVADKRHEEQLRIGSEKSSRHARYAT